MQLITTLNPNGIFWPKYLKLISFFLVDIKQKIKIKANDNKVIAFDKILIFFIYKKNFDKLFIV